MRTTVLTTLRPESKRPSSPILPAMRSASDALGFNSLWLFGEHSLALDPRL